MRSAGPSFIHGCFFNLHNQSESRLQLKKFLRNQHAYCNCWSRESRFTMISKPVAIPAGSRNTKQNNRALSTVVLIVLNTSTRFWMVKTQTLFQWLQDSKHCLILPSLSDFPPMSLSAPHVPRHRCKMQGACKEHVGWQQWTWTRL